MKQPPANQLNPRIKQVWRISDGAWIILLYLGCMLPFAIIGQIEPEPWIDTVVLVETIVFIVLLVVFLIILPPIRFIRWRYELTPEYLDIAKGIIWRQRYIIPFIRVQNTDTRQGPILRMFGLSSVTVATAAGNHEIPGLGNEEAEIVRDRAAELARIAREDV